MQICVVREYNFRGLGISKASYHQCFYHSIICTVDMDKFSTTCGHRKSPREMVILPPPPQNAGPRYKCLRTICRVAPKLKTSFI